MPSAFGALVAVWAVVSTVRRRRLSAFSSSGTAFDSVPRDGRLPAALAAVAGLLCPLQLAVILDVVGGPALESPGRRG